MAGFIRHIGTYKWDPLVSSQLTKINTKLDLCATNYPNTRCSAQQTPKVGVLRKTSTNKWWFVQFPLVNGRLTPWDWFDFGGIRNLRD